MKITNSTTGENTILHDGPEHEIIIISGGIKYKIHECCKGLHIASDDGLVAVIESDLTDGLRLKVFS